MENNKGNQIPSTTVISSNSLSTQQSTILTSPSQQTQSEMVPTVTTTTATITAATIISNTTASLLTASASQSKQFENRCDILKNDGKNPSAPVTDHSSVEKLTCDISNINLNKNKIEMDSCKATETIAPVSASTSAWVSLSANTGNTNDSNASSCNDITLNICSNCINCKCDKNKISAIRNRRIHSETASTIKPAIVTITKSSTIDQISPTIPSNRIIKSINQIANASTVQSPNVPISVERYPTSKHPTYLPAHFRNIPKTQSLDLVDDRNDAEMLPKIQPFDQARPIYPNVPYSPYGSPRSGRRRAPLRESRRISIEKSGSFLQLNQYKLMDQIGQVINFYAK